MTRRSWLSLLLAPSGSVESGLPDPGDQLAIALVGRLQAEGLARACAPRP